MVSFEAFQCITEIHVVGLQVDIRGDETGYLLIVVGFVHME